MNLLIIGGTVFLGRHLVEVALARGHAVTLFNRGQHNPELFPEVEKLRGDRKESLEPLRGRQFDAVIDTCGYVPRVVRASAEFLADQVGHYTFISSVSVYGGFTQTNITETAPVGTIADETVEEITGETYGPLKALCEQAAERAMPGRVLNIRPGLIIGPRDPTDRFTYWPHRVAQGGDVLAPNPPEQHVQFIDVRDLAEWNIRLVEAGQTGIYNATGPDYPLTMQRLLEVCKTESGSDARFVWMDETFLLEKEVGPWMEVPLWIPASANEAGHSSISLDNALASGLTIRPLSDTVRATLEWDATRPAEREWRAGLKPEREAELIAAWRDQTT